VKLNLECKVSVEDLAWSRVHGHEIRKAFKAHARSGQEVKWHYDVVRKCRLVGMLLLGVIVALVFLCGRCLYLSRKHKQGLLSPYNVPTYEATTAFISLQTLYMPWRDLNTGILFLVAISTAPRRQCIA
jgi:hypothetical protein